MRILLALTLFAAACAAPAEPAESLETIGPEQLVVETLGGGALDLRGKPVALVYWQSW